MTKDIWLNLPVKNVANSKAFFTEIGFSHQPGPGNSDHSASFKIGSKDFILMLFDEPTFQGFTHHPITDTATSAEVLISIDAESREEVDQLVDKVFEAGGTVFGKPFDQGWMYGFGFADLDGHRWNVLYMDMSQMPTP